MQARIERKLLDAFGRRLGNGLLGDMRAEIREGAARDRDRLVAGGCDLVRCSEAGLLDPLQHAFARLAGGFDETVRPACLGRLRERDEQGRLGGGEPLRLLAEIGEACGADAFEIAAEGREREIEVEDAGLVEAPLQLDGAYGLPELG